MVEFYDDMLDGVGARANPTGGPRAGMSVEQVLNRVIRKEDLHETDYTPWEGHEVAAWPSMTVLRGKIVVENGQFHASPGDGQFLQRKIPDEIRSRPAV